MSKETNLKPAKIDKKAPELLEIVINDKTTGKQLFLEVAKNKIFTTGSTGYNCSGKFTNLESGEKYQVTCNIILIGSKPGEKQ